jgi:hypothetical protein
MPKRLWDYGVQWVCEIMQHTTTSSCTCYSNGYTPLEMITVDTPDISEYVDFGIYDWVFYKDKACMGETKLGHMLGITHHAVPMMSFWILPTSCKVISCTTVQQLTLLDQQTEVYKNQCKNFDEIVKERMHNENHVSVLDEVDQPLTRTNMIFPLTNSISKYNKDLVLNDETLLEADDQPQTIEPTPGEFDPYVNMEISVPRREDNHMEFAKVT